ncbi:MAG: hypothetical protein PVH00_08145 [Gemmatimonadota bacterium]|jgi:fumarate reductase subunit D
MWSGSPLSRPRSACPHALDLFQTMAAPVAVLLPVLILLVLVLVGLWIRWLRRRLRARRARAAGSGA